MSVLHSVVGAVLAAEGEGYSAGDLTSDLTSGVADVLPYIGAGVGGGVVLLFAFMGIRKGFQFFKSIAK